ITYVMIYARKVSKQPMKSIVFEEDKKREIDTKEIEAHKLTKEQGLSLVILGVTLITLAFGVIRFDWYITEISALFVIMALVIGLTNDLGFNGTTKSFVRGCEELVVGALVIGFAYGALVILEESNTIDTILYAVTGVVANLPSSLTAIGMYVNQCLLHIVFTSVRGQVTLS